MRAFIALALPDEIRSEIAEAVSRLSSATRGFRWSSTSTMHVTLHFLGEVDAERFKTFAALVEGGFDAGGPLSLHLSGLGGFPDLRRPRVAWLGLAGDIDRLTNLHGDLGRGLTRLGFTTEPRQWSPHLTIGRAGREGGPSGLAHAAEEFSGWRSQSWVAAEVILYESILKPGGARHIAKARGPIRPS